MEAATMGGAAPPRRGPLDHVRPHPHRGDLVAAGAVLLTTALLLIDVRFTDKWAAFPRFLVVGVGAALVFGMALLAPMEGSRPRAYHSVLLVSGLALVLAALSELADALGGDGGSGS